MACPVPVATAPGYAALTVPGPSEPGGQAFAEAVVNAPAGGAMPGSDVGGECLDRIDDRVEAPGAEQVEPVLRAGQLRVDDRVGRCGA